MCIWLRGEWASKLVYKIRDPRTHYGEWHSVPLHKIRAYVACGGTEWMLFIKQKFPVSKDSLSVLGIASPLDLVPYIFMDMQK